MTTKSIEHTTKDHGEIQDRVERHGGSTAVCELIDSADG